MLEFLPDNAVVLLGVLLFAAAALYSSVGHGGASAYLAVLALFGISAREASTTALVLNCLVSAVALAAYARAGFFSWRLLVPFAAASIPASYAGGTIQVSGNIHHLLLAGALTAAAVRLWVTPPAAVEFRPPRTWIALPVGAAVGLVSGIVGIGGGIFLSPLMLFLGWADARRTACTAAAFVLLNSLAGLAGRAARTDLEFGNLLPLVVIAFAGGVLGSQLGARKMSLVVLCRALAVVLLLAVWRKLAMAG